MFGVGDAALDGCGGAEVAVQALREGVTVRGVDLTNANDRDEELVGLEIFAPALAVGFAFDGSAQDVGYMVFRKRKLGVLDALAVVEVFPPQEAREIGMLTGEPEVNADEVFHHLLEGVSIRHRLVLEFGEFAERIGQSLLVEQCLIGEIVVDHALAQPGLLHDVVDRRTVVSASRKERDGCLQQLVARADDRLGGFSGTGRH